MAVKRKQTALQVLSEDSAYSKKSAEILDYSYYDTCVMSAVSINNLFKIPQGQGGKTKADTNFTLAGQLPQGQNFKVFALKFFYFAIAARVTADLLAIYKMLFETTVEIKIPGKDSLGTYKLAEAFGIPSLVNLVPTVAGDNIPMVLSGIPGKIILNNPLKIGSNQSIEIIIEHHTPVTAALYGDKLTVSLNGRLVRLS
jgi:hypothetical protein